MQNLLYTYMMNSEGLEKIQAISLWGSEDLKSSVIFVNDVDDMKLFVNKVDSSSVISLKKKINKNGSTTFTFTKEVPYGNGFKAVFFSISNKSSFICISLLVVFLKTLYLSVCNERTCNVVSKERASVFAEYNRCMQKKRFYDIYTGYIAELSELYPHLFNNKETKRLRKAFSDFSKIEPSIVQSISSANLNRLKNVDQEWVKGRTDCGSTTDIRNTLDSLYSGVLHEPSNDPYVNAGGICIHHDEDNHTYVYGGDFQDPIASELFDNDGNVVNNVESMCLVVL